ncbi:MAG: hypothetical protein R2932_19080 [Caldilineaceae bacterium]
MEDVKLESEYISEAIVALGLSFNPFQYREASLDPYLPEYLVTEDLPAVVWEDGSVAVCAPVGSGKTALRIFSILTSWKKIGSPHPLPVSVVPDDISTLYATTLQEQVDLLFRSIVKSLFIGLVYRPERFLNLNDLDQQQLAAWFQSHLPATLSHYLRILENRWLADDIAHALDRSYRVQSVPSNDLLRLFHHELQQALEHSTRRLSANLDVSGQFDVRTLERLLNLIREQLNFTAVYFLVDGVDAFYETIQHPDLSFPWLQSLENCITNLRSEDLYLKCFLPYEICAGQQVSDLLASFRVQLQWTPERLIQLIRKRLLVASDGKLGNLDVICLPSISNLEEKILGLLPPVPREILIFCECLLIEYARQGFALIEDKHLEKALNQYQMQTPFR